MNGKSRLRTMSIDAFITLLESLTYTERKLLNDEFTDNKQCYVDSMSSSNLDITCIAGKECSAGSSSHLSSSYTSHHPHVPLLLIIAGVEQNPGPAESLREMWARRRNGWFDEEAATYWLTLSDREDIEMRDGETEEKTHNNNTLTRIPVSRAYRLLEQNVNPMKDSVSRNREGEFTFEIPRDEVEEVLKINNLEEIPVKFSKHKYKNASRGTVWNVGTIDMTEGEIINELKDIPALKVIKKKRYNKQLKQRVYSGELTITFDVAQLPKRINILWLKNLEVTQYEPQPLQCNMCYQFNSECFLFDNDKLTNKCKVISVKRCSWCLKIEHLANPDDKCEDQVMCGNCQIPGDHASWSKECPVYKKEFKIKCTKEILKVSYKRAKEIEGKNKPKKANAASVTATDLETQKKEWKRIIQETTNKYEEKLENTKSEYEERLKSEIKTNNEMWQERLRLEQQKFEIRGRESEERMERMVHQMTSQLQLQMESMMEAMKQVIPTLPTSSPFPPTFQTQPILQSPTLQLPSSLQLPATFSATASLAPPPLFHNETAMMKQLEQQELHKLNKTLSKQNEDSAETKSPDPKRTRKKLNTNTA